MIQIKRVDFIPKLSYAAYSRREVLLGASHLREIEGASEGIWVVAYDEKPVLVVGTVRSSFLSVPRLWVLVCDAFSEEKVSYNLRMLKKVMQVVPNYYPMLETLVEDGWKTGERFAKFAGFRPREAFAEIMGKKFRVWEL